MHFRGYLLVGIFILLLISLAIVFALSLAWLNTLISPMSFTQTLLISSLTIIVLELVSVQNQGSPFDRFNYGLMFISGTIISLILVQIAVLVNKFAPLNLWEATIFTSGFSLAIFYSLNHSFQTTLSDPQTTELMREIYSERDEKEELQSNDEEAESVERTDRQVKQAKAKSRPKKRR